MNRILTYLLATPIIFLGAISININAQQEIEEIVVSATKRDESLQDVNIAINAFNNEDLNQLNWDDITNVAAQSPNVDIKYAWGNSMPIYTIRGVGMNSFQASDFFSCERLIFLHQRNKRKRAVLVRCLNHNSHPSLS